MKATTMMGGLQMPKIKDMTTSAAGLKATAIREGGCRVEAYDDKIGRRNGKPDPGARGVWTYGFGFIWKYDAAGNRVPVQKGDKITPEEADRRLLEEIRLHEDGVQIALGPDTDLTQYQFDALSDHCFQFGKYSLAGRPVYNSAKEMIGRQGSSIARAILRNEPWKIPAAFGMWKISAGKNDDGVYNRSMARMCQFHNLPWEFCYDPTPENKLMTVDDATGKILKQIVPDIVLAKARAFSAVAAAPATSDGVPDKPAPVANESAQAPAQSQETATKEAPMSAPITVEPLPEAKAPPGKDTVPAEKVPLPNVKPENGAKPQTESRRFWESVWLAIGHVFIDLSKKGVFALVPAWSIPIVSEVALNPYVIGALVAATLAVLALLAAGAIMVKRSAKRLVVAVQEATQVTF